MKNPSNHVNILEKNILALYGNRGKQWLANLPKVILILKEYWQLENIMPVTTMNYNYVVKATHQHHGAVVIKISCDQKTLEEELRALKHFDGDGSIILIDDNPEYQALLLQQAVPGNSLKDLYLKHPEKAMERYVDVMKKLHKKAAPQDLTHFLHINDWFKVLDCSSSNQLPTLLLKKAKYLKDQQIKTMKENLVLHGDLHHDNILLNGHEWLAIDPKGIIGEPEFELAAFDLIRDSEMSDPRTIKPLLFKRITQLSTLAALDESRVRDWVFLRIMLSAAWFVEDKGDPQKMLHLAETFIEY
ncbi:aminoglycoside phosphotransferase family protein [Candidatus Nucleicultrix amoebiphila]|jgi:streptomycin 6-kinase|uniref:Aminoglycoside/hydroxyurea antibiotic resistance kinase n=1 Tax=Candidatus Nucleicultrix amoebiphila FS5 TaxID=1414854 RepID=A0A1W6N5I8_9PROT|nr:aminoglycoside phosphotransferase family protein [Candidatus Nucleicultrix amoebiphila]ARN85029.1 hypothetical protein GQ61_06685 [Candidatus Nucleicultrix amoebiphila FS5]